MLGKWFAGVGWVLLVLILIGVGTGVIAQDDAETRIASAMSAAPLSIAEGATVIDLAEDGSLVVLREGTNDWTCIPDMLATPGPDQMCLDPVWVTWLNAWLAGEDPDITAPGLAYMLAGGIDASNTDPFATEPAEGDDWVMSSPHIMVLFPDGTDLSVFSTEHGSGNPWIMFADTPYAHIMMPVSDEMMDMMGQ